MTALVLREGVAWVGTRSILCLVKWRGSFLRVRITFRNHKASGTFRKLHANAAAIGTRKGGRGHTSGSDRYK
jgi:hypothetical protein